MGKTRRSRADHQADTRGKGWVGIPQVVVDSAAYRGLSIVARAILIEIARRFNGYNNGRIAISQRELGARLRSSNWKKIGRAIAELMHHGLIDISAEGTLLERRAREYRLTFVSTTDGLGRFKPATNDYLRWSE